MKKIVFAAGADGVDLCISRDHAQQIADLKSSGSRHGIQPKKITPVITDLLDAGMIARNRFTGKELYPTNLGLAALGLYLAYGGELSGREN